MDEGVEGNSLSLTTRIKTEPIALLLGIEISRRQDNAWVSWLFSPSLLMNMKMSSADRISACCLLQCFGAIGHTFGSAEVLVAQSSLNVADSSVRPK
jgi:hypothetical protein